VAQTHGWTGRILRVDLSTGAHESQRLPADIRTAFLGGRGLGGYFLRDGATLCCDHPDLPLTIASGPLTGTDAPASGSCHITTRSPLTGAVGDASAGGRLGTELKRAGFDALVITGRADKPCGIEISDGEVRLTDASALCGLPTPDVFTRLRQRLPHGSLAATGPAAENGCLFATVLVDLYHQAGRCGVGNVFGLKNLKYLAVRGTGEVAVADPAGLARAREDILRLASASPALMGQHGFTNFGTGSLYDLMDARRMMPTDNFARTHFEPAGELNAHAYATRYHPLRRGCESCLVACKRLSGDGRPLPEYDAMSHFTALIGNGMIELAMRANDFCACLGLDPVSAASALACHREITGEALDPERVLALLLGMGTGTGPAAETGRMLAQGAARYAAAQGRPELAMSVKGLELPAYDPRGAYGLALAYAVATHGGSNLRANPLSHEVLRKPVATDRFSFSGKARSIKLAEDAAAAADSLTVCAHLLLAAGMEEYARAFAAVTGLAATGGDLLACGARIDCQERLMNAQNGFSAKDDDLPARFFAEDGSGSPDIPVPPVPRQDFLDARSAYYRIRGLTPDGLPTPEMAQRFGLPWPALPRGHVPGRRVSPPPAGTGEKRMSGMLAKHASKLAAAGLCAPGEPLLAALDAELSLSHAGDARQPVAEAVLQGLGAAALLFARPIGACQQTMLALAEDALASGADFVVPGDCETRTFLHDLPVVRGLSADGVINALSRRKGCIVVENGQALMAAAGSVSPEQAFVTASSMAFACFVAYFAQHLRDVRAGIMTADRRARFAAIRAQLERDTQRLPQTPPPLLAGPFESEEQARAAMIEAGRFVVEYGLVDSSFGNVSCRQPSPAGELLLISQTGSSLDELGGCIDPCRFDGASCAGLTASSELVAHRAIYDGGGAKTILHGHPRFSVILSMDCGKLDCPGLGECHRACATPRGLLDAATGLDIPIVPGEVGTGPFGLCNTLPPALTQNGGKRGAIVYGHGLFATGAVDFRDAFATLLAVERYSREEYFRRVDRLDADAARTCPEK